MYIPILKVDVLNIFFVCVPLFYNITSTYHAVIYSELPVRRGHIVYLKFSNQGDLKYGTSFAKKCSSIKTEFKIKGK